MVTRASIPVRLHSHFTEEPQDSFMIVHEEREIDLEVIKRAIALLDVGFRFDIYLNVDGTISYNIADDIDEYVNVMYWADEPNDLVLDKFKELILQLPVDRVIEIRRDWNERYPVPATASDD